MPGEFLLDVPDYSGIGGLTPDGTAVFARILLAARPIVAVFDNVLAAAFPALSDGGSDDHMTTIQRLIFIGKKIHSSFRGYHYQRFYHYRFFYHKIVDKFLRLF